MNGDEQDQYGESLSSFLQKTVEKLLITEEEKEVIRREIISDLKEAVGLDENIILMPFGSLVSGLAWRGSDIDLHVGK